jgi:hypothetical protein
MDTIISLHQQMDAIQTLAEVEQVAAAVATLYSELRKKKAEWKAANAPVINRVRRRKRSEVRPVIV